MSPMRVPKASIPASSGSNEWLVVFATESDSEMPSTSISAACRYTLNPHSTTRNPEAAFRLGVIGGSADELGRHWGEIVGATAVLITLGFLTLQLRQSNQTQRFAVYQSYLGARVKVRKMQLACSADYPQTGNNFTGDIVTVTVDLL